MPWGSTDVLVQTQHAARNAGLTVALLEELPDVDLPEDVPAAEALLAAERVGRDARISVVVPALDDAALVAAAVQSALAGGAAEVVVADGGSADDTAARAAAAGARVVAVERGRARQMNAGAAETTGDVLCFLHADTVLPHGWADAVRSALGAGGVVAAAFDFAVPTGARHSATLQAGGTLRWRLTGTPYGDQAICVPRHVFEALGGYPDLPVMEDLELASRLKRFGRVVRIPLPAVTSARSWDENGLVRPTLVNAVGIAAYRLGVSPRRIAAWRQRIAAR
jgi:rSAM/selenodomain-associated transferase 2